jgi:hypothetical protein
VIPTPKENFCRVQIQDLIVDVIISGKTNVRPLLIVQVERSLEPVT